MKKPRILLSVLLAAVLMCAVCLPAFATSPFGQGERVTVLTGSDFQDTWVKAYDRFSSVLSGMKADGMATPHSMLVGGDYTKILFDDAAPGIELIRQNLVAVYPDADPEKIVCIQGNHDNPSPGFTKTGFYDMGAYALYCINEDDFPWLQTVRLGLHVQKIAADLKANLDAMIANGDRRPVIVLTHLPLHHTSRALYGDNRFASYIFDVLEDAGNTLDVIFLFGHQHSGDYDDYIGGSVNFMRPGDVIRVPDATLPGENAYTERTLTFTYANCGYIGYSDNTEGGGSTNALTLGAILFGDEDFTFVKYGESGLLRADTVERKNAGTDAAEAGAAARRNEKLWNAQRKLILKFMEMIRKLLALFGK